MFHSLHKMIIYNISFFDVMQLRRSRRQDIIYQLHFGVLKKTF